MEHHHDHESEHQESERQEVKQTAEVPPPVSTPVVVVAASGGDLLPPLDSLKCTLCNEFFKEPLTLSCMHSFCTKCLLKEHNATLQELPLFMTPPPPAASEQQEPQHEQRKFQCPTCVNKLKLDVGLMDHSEPFVNQRLSRIVSLVLDSKVLCENCKNSQSEKLCSVCNVNLCTPCWTTTHSAKIFAKHQAKPLRHSEMTALPKCAQHILNEQEFFVTEEETGACQVCLLKGNFVGAQYSLVSDVRNERQVEIDSSLEDVALAKLRLVEGREDNLAVLQELEVSFSESTQAVMENFRLIREALDKRQGETLEALEVLKQAKKRFLEAQVLECNTLIDQIDDGVENVRLVLAHSNPLEVIYQTVVITEHLNTIGNVPSTAPKSCLQCSTDKLQCHHPSVDSSLPVLLSDKVPNIVMAYAAVPTPEFVEEVATGLKSDSESGLPQASQEQKEVLKQVAAGSEEYGCVVM